jgi:hypothetical protein
MLTRTTTSTIVFRRPFHIAWIDHEFPAGSYEVVTEEEQLDGISFLAYRRLQTYIYRQSTGDRLGLEPTYDVDPEDLAAALAQDVIEQELPA